MLMAGWPVSSDSLSVLCDSVTAGAEPLPDKRVQRAVPAALMSILPGGLLTLWAAVEFALKMKAALFARLSAVATSVAGAITRQELPLTALSSS